MNTVVDTVFDNCKTVARIQHGPKKKQNGRI